MERQKKQKKKNQNTHTHTQNVRNKFHGKKNEQLLSDNTDVDSMEASCLNTKKTHYMWFIRCVQNKDFTFVI